MAYKVNLVDFGVQQIYPKTKIFYFRIYELHKRLEVSLKITHTICCLLEFSPIIASSFENLLKCKVENK